MKRNSIVLASAITIAGALLNGCGSSSTSGGGGGGNGSAAISTLSAIPTATGPVVSSRSLDGVSFSLSKTHLPIVETTSSTPFKTQETRPWVSMKASDWSNNTWTGKSAPLCDAGNQVSQLFRDASQPDKILCYISAMENGGLFTGNNYDNNWKFYEVQNVPVGPGRNSRASLLVKFKIQKAENGGILDFKMYTADEAPERRDCSNGEFIHADLSSGATITTVYGGANGKARIQATGTLNTAGDWVSKQITAHSWWSNGGNDSGNYSVLNQFADYLTMSGSMVFNYGTGINKNQLYSKMALVDAASFAELEFGAGSTKMQSDWDGNGTADFIANRSWNATGDRILSTSGTYYADVASATLLDIKTPEEVSAAADFISGETWDCTADEPGSSFVTVDFASGSAAAGIAACDAKFGDGGQWTSCYNSGAYYNDVMSVSSITPSSGPAGTNFVISGTGFQGYGGWSVTVGGESTNCTSFSDTSLTCQAPFVAASGAQPVIVTVGSDSVSAGNFTYP